MLFIIAGWAASLQATPPLRLSVLYFIGSLLLTIYAFVIRDPIFTLLNALASALALANIARALKLRAEASQRPGVK
ncbi:hypothetical protein CF15_05820 [Pyrodictium occultum]|uniref:Lipid A biosynthesis N-terminal domain-containing protein n=2 Tax=Pyrodictium occultum TaxID=2309 RepID=A0A0V8RXH1_PYROC|nr:hypothetical protein CF15_05820 [Pyrodictium occultum]